MQIIINFTKDIFRCMVWQPIIQDNNNASTEGNVYFSLNFCKDAIPKADITKWRQPFYVTEKCTNSE